MFTIDKLKRSDEYKENRKKIKSRLRLVTEYHSFNLKLET